MTRWLFRCDAIVPLNCLTQSFTGSPFSLERLSPTLDPNGVHRLPLTNVTHL